MCAVDEWARLSEEMVLDEAQLVALRAIALKRAPAALEALERAETAEDRFYALPDAAFAAWRLERWDDARRFAGQALSLADEFNNWNHGNAVHAGHTVSGLLALREGDRSGAVRSLLASGTTPGSPQLDSFGPTMELAVALLDAGEHEAVLCYLEKCGEFWVGGEALLAIWRRKIAAGEMPNFFHHRYG